MLYMLMFLLLSVALSAGSIHIASNVENQINRSYVTTENQSTFTSGQGKVVVIAPIADYTSKDERNIKICRYIEMWSISLLFGFCIVLSSLIFYRNKLKEPIELLRKASDKIYQCQTE
jgi:hypothetical protein